MRLARRIVLWSLGALLSTLVVAVVFLSLAGDGFYRWVLDEVVEGAIDREVTVDGSFSFELGLEPKVIVTDVWMENAGWTGKKEMARAERLELQIALRPLFSGIVRIPRLVVEGLSVELEKAPGEAPNWHINTIGQRSPRPADIEKIVYPLIDFISLNNIAVAYRNRETGQEIKLVLNSLKKLEQRSEDALVEIRGQGTINDQPFTVAADAGTVEAAIEARAPFPLKIVLQSPNSFTELSGTIGNIPAGKGIDLTLVSRTPSIYEALRSLQIETQTFGPAVASVRLKGDLDNLAAEDLQAELIAPSGQSFKAEGRVANLTRGNGLDIRFSGKIDPQIASLFGDIPAGVAELLDGITDVDAAGQVTGDLPRPSVNDVAVDVQHISGAEVSLRAAMTADLSGDNPALAQFEAQTEIFLPDEKILKSALGVRMPELREMTATADLFWEGDQVTARLVTLKGRALDEVSLQGEGPLGRLSGEDFTFELDVQAALSGNTASSRPLFYLIEGFSSGSGVPTAIFDYLWGDAPKRDAAEIERNLVLQIQRALIATGIDPGGRDGQMGPNTRAAIEQYQQSQGLTVDGRPSRELLDHLSGEAAASPDPEAPTQRVKPPPTYELTAALPNLGTTEATMKLFFKDGQFRFEEMDLRVGEKDAERVAFRGFLGNLPAGPTGLLTDIDVAVTFGAPSLDRFRDLLPSQTPHFTAIEGQFNLGGTEDVLIMEEIAVTAEGPFALTAGVKGRIGSVILGTESSFTEMALELSGQTPTTQGLFDFINQEVPVLELPEGVRPELGAVMAQATLRDAGDTLAVDSILITAGPSEAPTVEMTGDIADVMAWTGIEISGQAEAPTKVLLEVYGQPVEGELGVFETEFGLTDADGSIGAEPFQGAITNSDLISLSLDGKFDDLANADGIELTISLETSDLAALGRRLGFDAEGLGRFVYDGVVAGSAEVFTAEGKAKLGETDVTGSLSASMTGERPSVQAEIRSPLLRLADIGISPEDDVEDGVADTLPAEPPAQTSSEWVFDESPIPFDSLHNLDLELDVVVEAIEGVDLDIDKAQAQVILVDGELKVDPLAFEFVGGHTDLTLLVDANGSLPKVSLEVSASGIHLERLLAQTETEVPLDGNMDVIADLKASGGTPRALASSLDGSLDLAIEDGHVRTSLLDLATSNPARWVFSETAIQGYSDLNCLILRFEVDDGLAKGKTIMLDTPNSQAMGEGSIDLKDETLDITVNPRPKRERLISFSTPFEIEGRLADPAINVNTSRASVGKSSEVLLGPVNLLGSLLPFVGGDDDEDGKNSCLNLEEPAPEG